MKLKLIHFAYAAAIFTISPANATPFDGLYSQAGTSWTCNPNDVGMDGGALAISDDSLIGLESTCQLTNPTDIRGMAAILYDAQCSAEGEQYSYRVMLMTHDDGIFVITDAYVSDWKSCTP